MSEVRLVDLEIIKRYSLAIRQETASADELLAALDASRAVVAAAAKSSKSSKAAKPARTRKSSKA
jgi:hypothetical protein